MRDLRRVVGKSMEPTLKDGQLILVFKTRNFKIGDVVVAFMNRREVVKRIININEGQVFLEGDNRKESTDSRDLGGIIDTHVIGKVVWPRDRRSR